jgi:hypothetical protein
LGKNDQFTSFIRQIIDQKPGEAEHDFVKDTHDICSQWNWNMSEANKNNEPSPVETEDGNYGHVMISYNTGSRGLCLQVKSELEASGYKVWMDVQDIHGSSLDAMAKAVEGACAVLMCVTEKYRESINCQSEAQCAFRCRKPIVPCIMQKGCENMTGWLDMIMGDKIFCIFCEIRFC